MLLPRSPFGYVTQGLGHAVSNGSVGLIAPTREIKEPIEELVVDGVRMIFHLTPDTEAPAEMNTHFPDKKALWMAENVQQGMHNTYTLRGTRDAYANLNNQVLHHANQGVTINQSHNVYTVPESLQQSWFTRDYHGSHENNSRGVIQRFLGYWDGNPATQLPLSPEDSGPLYVEMMGGAERIMTRGRELIAEGKYRHAFEILNRLVQGEPDNRAAKDLLADAFEQVGYQQENPGLRNSFLAAALSWQPFALADDDEGDANLAQQLANPVAALISVPFQLNYQSGIGPADDDSQWVLNIQAVIPFSLNED